MIKSSYADAKERNRMENSKLGIFIDDHSNLFNAEGLSVKSYFSEEDK